MAPLRASELVLTGRLDLPQAGDWWEPVVVTSGDLLVTAAADLGKLAIYRRAPGAPTGWELDGVVGGDDTPALYRSAAVAGATVVGSRLGYVDLLNRGPDGWQVDASIPVSGAGSGFGWLLAADAGRFVVVARQGLAAGTALFNVYRRTGSSFELEATLEPGLRYGDGLILSGSDLIVAGRHPHPALPKVYSYRFDGSNWSLIHSLEVADLSDYPQPVALAGDLLAVGRAEAHETPPLSGAVDLYQRSAGSTWALAATLTTTAEGMLPEFARFGSAVAITTEGIVIVSAPAMQTGCPADPTCVIARRDARLYAFRLEHGEWTEVARWIGPGDGFGVGLPAGMLGYSIAVEGDSIVATAPFAPESGLRVFALLPGTLEIPTLSLTMAAVLATLIAGAGFGTIMIRRKDRLGAR